MIQKYTLPGYVPFSSDIEPSPQKQKTWSLPLMCQRLLLSAIGDGCVFPRVAVSVWLWLSDHQLNSISVFYLIYLHKGHSTISDPYPQHPPHSLSSVVLMCVCMWERGWVCIMACNGICFWTRVSETPEEGEKGRKTDREWRRRGMGDGWDISCSMFKKGLFPPSFFPPLVFEVNIHSSVQ